MITPEPVLTVRGVSKAYRDDAVLADLTFDVKRSETTVIIGPSGAGKSTLLRCIAGLEPVDSGEIIFDNRVMSASKRIRYELAGEIGMVFQSVNLFPHLTARDNVALAPCKVRGLNRREALVRANDLLAQVGLASKGDAYPEELSGGQQQRVAIARSLAMKPKLMLFDEPTAALDRELTQEVLETMTELAAGGMTLLVVTHELEFARRAANRVIFMEAGRLVEVGSPEILFSGGGTERTRGFLGHG